MKCRNINTKIRHLFTFTVISTTIEIISICRWVGVQSVGNGITVAVTNSCNHCINIDNNIRVATKMNA